MLALESTSRFILVLFMKRWSTLIYFGYQRLSRKLIASAKMNLSEGLNEPNCPSAFLNQTIIDFNLACFNFMIWYNQSWLDFPLQGKNPLSHCNHSMRLHGATCKENPLFSSLASLSFCPTLPEDSCVQNCSNTILKKPCIDRIQNQ